WTKPLRGIRVARPLLSSDRRLGNSVALFSSLGFRPRSGAKAWNCCLQQIPFGKGAFHDIPSATHDRGHAGAESRPEHSNFLRATGIPVRPSLRQITGTVGP